MPINPKPLGWLAAGAILGLLFALSTKSWGPAAFAVLALFMAASYLYVWTNTPRRPTP